MNDIDEVIKTICKEVCRKYGKGCDWLRYAVRNNDVWVIEKKIDQSRLNALNEILILSKRKYKDVSEAVVAEKISVIVNS